jgi:hypothetical protein
MTDAPTDTARAHRWFAVEFNNRAWDLVEKVGRSATESDEMIHSAHAACIHWLAVGKAINHVRAQCLLATAYASAGLGEAAVRHAEKCLELCKTARDETTAFDKATAFGCAATAYACNGQMELGREYYQKALQEAENLDSEDRPVFDKLYSRPS